jgi:chemotaxis regulatin CheY-phosphate phosphatase CheZ
MAGDERGNGWTLGTLKEFLEDKIIQGETRTAERFALSKLAVDAALAAAEKAITAAMAAAEKAVTKAEVAAEKRFDSVNEFRNAMKDQQTTFADKAQTDFRLAALEKRLDLSGGRSIGRNDVIGWIVACIATAAAVVAAIMALRGH